MMEAQEVITLRPVGHVDDARLVGCQRQPQPGKDLAERGKRRFGSFPARAADAFIVRLAHEHPQAGVPLSPFPIQPVQDHIGEDGRKRTALRGALRRVRQHCAVEYPSGQDGPDELQHPPVADPVPKTFENKIVTESVERDPDLLPVSRTSRPRCTRTRRACVLWRRPSGC